MGRRREREGGRERMYVNDLVRIGHDGSKLRDLKDRQREEQRGD